MKHLPSPETTPPDTTDISPNPPENRGLDYVWLREKGVRITQALSSSIWTDYNEHDPGVTTLEQLCYALTELSYRAELPLTDMLADPVTGDIHPRRHGMFIARRILPCNAVTVNDYRKLIVDRVRAVRNVWLTPRVPKAGSGDVNGLYDIAVYAPESDECHNDCEYKPRRIVERVTQVYCRNRNLCEDIHSVRLLAPLPLAVHAEVNIAAGASAERTLAAILFSIGNLVAPELPRQSLKTLLDAGMSTDQIFNGPLLVQGFIPDSSLQPAVTAVAVNDIVRAIAESTGVTGARKVMAQTRPSDEEGSGRYRVNQSIPVPHGRYLHLDTKPNPDTDEFTIRLFRNGKIVKPDPRGVDRALSQMWAAYRRGYPLEAQYEEYLGAPTGQARDFLRYYSIQNQYPLTYGIGTFGLRPDATETRRAQAHQFKAYLLPFEQLMADYFAQLAHVSDLFSIAPAESATYYWQSLEKSVPNVDPLLSPDYRDGMQKIVSGVDDPVNRRNRFLAFFLSLYANDLHAERENGGSLPPDSKDLLRARLAFLQVLVPSTRSRGRAFDYMAKPGFRNFAGMEIKCRIEIGLDLETHQPLSAALDYSRISLARSPAVASLGRAESHVGSHTGEDLIPVLSYPAPEHVPEFPSILKGGSVTEDLVEAASDLNNLYVGRHAADGSVLIVCRAPGGGWIFLDAHLTLKAAIIEAYALARHLKTIHHARTQLYIVEHTLLRHGRRPSRKHDAFVYSFTLTAVVSMPSWQRQNRDSRITVEEIIRENTPADTLAQVCFLDPWSMLDFEWLNGRWREALYKGRNIPIALASARLRRFLERHRDTTTAI